MYRNRWIIIFLLLSSLIFGCGKKDEIQIVKKLDFTIVAEERLPVELSKQIDEKKGMPFKITFQDKNFLYICVGYGEQEQGGYSIVVNALDELKNAILVDTELIGPKPKQNKKEGKSYPYIVIKTEPKDLPVIFD